MHVQKVLKCGESRQKHSYCWTQKTHCGSFWKLVKINLVWLDCQYGYCKSRQLKTRFHPLRTPPYFLNATVSLTPKMKCLPFSNSWQLLPLHYFLKDSLCLDWLCVNKSSPLQYSPCLEIFLLSKEAFKSHSVKWDFCQLQVWPKGCNIGCDCMQLLIKKITKVH